AVQPRRPVVLGAGGATTRAAACSDRHRGEFPRAPERGVRALALAAPTGEHVERVDPPRVPCYIRARLVFWRFRMAMVSGGQLVAKMLKQEGVSHVFTLSGLHIAPIYAGCVEEGIKVVDTRHEQAAGHAADAWARLTRGL